MVGWLVSYFVELTREQKTKGISSDDTHSQLLKPRKKSATFLRLLGKSVTKFSIYLSNENIIQLLTGMGRWGVIRQSKVKNTKTQEENQLESR